MVPFIFTSDLGLSALCPLQSRGGFYVFSYLRSSSIINGSVLFSVHVLCTSITISEDSLVLGNFMLPTIR